MRNAIKRHPRIAAALGALAAAGLLPGTARAAQFELTVLNTSPFDGGEANGVWEGRSVGDISGLGGVLWTSSSSYVPLTPQGYGGSVINGIWGNQQVGWVPAPPNDNGNRRAALWNGSAAAFVDLSGGRGISWVDATDGDQQVGNNGGGAALWTGTPGSYIDLSAGGYSFSEATSVWNGIQVGYGGQVPNTDALLWHGSASGFVVLRSGAEALGISRGQVVGFAGVNGTNVAALWANATSDSFANLAPVNTTASELLATNGVQQVGDVSLTHGALGQLPIDHHPAVWHGTPSSFQMLPLPQGDNYGSATGIDGDGNICGFVGTQSAGTIGNFLPALWTQPHLPGDANFDGSVGFDDLIVLAKDFGKPGEWVDGDFNGDGMAGRCAAIAEGRPAPNPDSGPERQRRGKRRAVDHGASDFTLIRSL